MPTAIDSEPSARLRPVVLAFGGTTASFVLLLFACASIHGQANPIAADEAIATELARLDSIWLASYATQDVEAVERILAPDFVGQLGATMVDKQAILEGVAGSTEVVGMPLERISVNIFGDVGVVRAVRRIIVQLEDGTLEESRFAYTDVYRRREDRWLCITGQSASLPPDA